VIVADAAPSATAARADLFVPVAADAQFEVLWTLRAIINGVNLDTQRVRQATGTSLETAEDLARRLLGARYGAWFYGTSLYRGRSGSACVEAALGLVRDLNARTRFVILPLGAPRNVTGAESVLTWQSGSPQSVDFAGDFPRALAEESSAATRLARAEADAALIVADAVEEWLPAAARERLERIPRVVIAPRATAADPTPGVALRAASPGIDAGGAVTRVDGVVLRLRPPLAASVPSDLQWLQALRHRFI
jgi:formylmethanofuran dehydrogenase subunit B